DDPARDPADIGVVAEGLAPIDVGEMDLDDRQLGGGKRVHERDRGVRVGAGIEDDAVGGLPRLVDPIDKLALVVRLPAVELEAQLGGTLEAGLLDVGERLPAVDLRLAQAQEIEIGSIEDEYRRIAGHGRPSALRNLVPYNTRSARSKRARWSQRDQLTRGEAA